MFLTSCAATLASSVFTLASGVHVHLGHLDTQQIEDYTFDEFVRDFSRSYQKGTAEWASRETTFKRNIQRIIEQRAYATTWTVGINKFVDYHDHEYNMLLGYKGRRRRDRPAPYNTSAYGGLDVADVVDTTKGPNSVYAAKVIDQGMCGSCWAAGAIATLEGVVEKTNPGIFEELAKGTPKSLTATAIDFFAGLFGGDKATSLRSSSSMIGLSMQEMVSCTPNHKNCGGQGGCTGATAELGYDQIKKHGLLASSAWPYTSGVTGLTGGCTTSTMSRKKLPKIKLSGYKVLEQNKFLPLKEAIYTKGHPIAIAIDATNWNFYQGGIYSDVAGGRKGDFTVNHEVTLVGYHSPSPSAASVQSSGKDQGYWRIKNSWGTTWGEQGFIKIEMKADEEKHCGWDYDTHIGLACDGDPDQAWVCGTCGILYDSLYPEGVTLEY